ncbi:hypothetical protein BFGS084_04219 [Bacteroides fragilis]|nr:hypothetical protein BFGS084_04219 [Bacteroides fragilis]
MPIVMNKAAPMAACKGNQRIPSCGIINGINVVRLNIRQQGAKVKARHKLQGNSKGE